MEKVAAGLLMYRHDQDRLEFFLVHPGGPYFRKKDAGHWTIPKGAPEGDEPLLETAQREFLEETGIRPLGPFCDLGTVRQKGGKLVYAWAFSGNWDPDTGIRCNSFTIEWPPASGRKAEFPEVDKAAWYPLDTAMEMIIPAQRPFLERATDLLSGPGKQKNHPPSD